MWRLMPFDTRESVSLFTACLNVDYLQDTPIDSIYIWVHHVPQIVY